jgi:tRNA(fMet)-specific endonuclease VapC
MYLLDTSTCIELIRNRSPAALERLTQCTVGDVGISAIAVAELEYGVAKSTYARLARQRLDGFLAPLQILAFDDAAAAAYGPLRAALEAKGTPIGSLDLLIAAQALSIGAIVVTGNVKEFRRVPKLSVENWAAED